MAFFFECPISLTTVTFDGKLLVTISSLSFVIATRAGLMSYKMDEEN